MESIDPDSICQAKHIKIPQKKTHDRVLGEIRFTRHSKLNKTDLKGFLLERAYCE